MSFSPDESQKIVDYPVYVYIDEEGLVINCPDEFYIPIPYATEILHLHIRNELSYQLEHENVFCPCT